MVKIYPEIINFLFFCPEKIKYYPKKISAQSFTRNLPKKFAQSPSPVNMKLILVQVGKG